MAFFKTEPGKSLVSTLPEGIISAKFDIRKLSPRQVYGEAYHLARKGYYKDAASYLMQIEPKEIALYGFDILTFEQLCEVTRVSPSCATLLLADDRHFRLFNLEKIIDYLKIAPDAYTILFKEMKILNQIDDTEAIGKVLAVVPKAILFFNKMGLLSKFIKTEQHLTVLAQIIPNLMPCILEDFNFQNLIQKGEVVVSLICQAPQLVPLTAMIRVATLLKTNANYAEVIKKSLHSKAESGDLESNKMLGMAYFEGIGIFSKDVKKALSYLEKVSDQYPECAEKVGQYYLEQLNAMLKNFEWQDFVILAKKIPVNSSCYRESLIVCADALFSQPEEHYKRAALGYFIEAYELKTDDTIERYIDQILAGLYLGDAFLEGKLTNPERTKLIAAFKEEILLLKEVPNSKKSCCIL